MKKVKDFFMVISMIYVDLHDTNLTANCFVEWYAVM